MQRILHTGCSIPLVSAGLERGGRKKVGSEQKGNSSLKPTIATVTRVGVLLAAALVAGVTVLSGCATTPTRVDTGAIRAKTYNFTYMGSEGSPTLEVNVAQIHAIMQAAIEKNLAAKGLTKVAKGGDVTVLYLIIVSNGGLTQSLNEYYGSGQSAHALEAKAHEAFDVENKNRTQFEAGTLVIDIAQFNPYRVFWRNFVCRPVLKNPPVAEREARIQEAVDEVLQGVRVAK